MKLHGPAPEQVRCGVKWELFMKHYCIKNLLILIVFLLPVEVFASVVINEVAWMGSEISWSDEWIELYNNTDSSINLEGWTLKADDGTPEIILSKIIPANGFYLLERTDDDTVPDITADQTYTGALSNNGEHLKLFDNQNNLIDEVNCNDNWFFGDNNTKQTMERINPLLNSDSSNWQTSKNPNGSPRTINSVLVQQEVEPEQEEEQVYPANIIFNEILPSPEGPDFENEYIEIFNKNDFDVDLSDWKIRDSIGSINTFNFPKNTIIKAQNYLIVMRPETKIILNNDADSLNLIQPDSAVVDNVSYEKAKIGQSYSLIGSNWVWSQEPTPGKDNIIKTPSDFENKKVILKEKSAEIKQNNDLKELASVLSQNPENNDGFSELFLMALTIAIFSAAIILFLKKAINLSERNESEKRNLLL